MKTVKVKPSSPDQGEFVVINASDFNPNIHELCEGEKLDGAFKANLIPGEPADLSGLRLQLRKYNLLVKIHSSKP